MSIRARNGTRCTTRCGASSETFSTRRIIHGLNLAEAEKKYAAYLSGVGGRDDLNYLFMEMLGELTVGHMFIGGGDVPEAPKVKGGLLGADYKVENGRYRFARIYNGENWNPQLAGAADATGS